MKSLSIPVRVIGPGSQPEEEPLQYLDIPREMDTFHMPLVPERADVEALAEARDVLQEFLDVFEAWDPSLETPGPRLDLRTLSPAALTIVNEMLGDGEVSVKLDGRRRAHIQESVFAGIWRVCELDSAERMLGDWIEGGTIPEIVLETAHAAAAPSPAMVEMVEGAMNSPALLHEIREQVASRPAGRAAHVINLTLFPLTPEDHRVLERALPVGPVAIISRGFGNCRITSTLARHVWRVQYFNTMNTLILNTLEIVDTPEVALAAPEDLADSRERLAELIAWMSESCPVTQ
jgi:hydrogenase-1 operon protein HyaF